jgi:hypothetical protein
MWTHEILLQRKHPDGDANQRHQYGSGKEERDAELLVVAQFNAR